MAPSSQGLYNPAFEHDACGVAMVADMHGRRSRDRITVPLPGVECTSNTLDSRRTAPSPGR